MWIAGVDPGLDGAIAFLDAESHRVIAIVDMPCADAKGRREIVTHELVRDVVQTLDGRRVGHAWIEQQSAFAGGGRRTMGATSAFRLGRASMVPEMLAVCLGWPFERIAPAVWKRSYGLGADKAEALLTASRLLPHDVEQWHHQRGLRSKATAIGRAEAALVALYGINRLYAISGGRAA